MHRRLSRTLRVAAASLGWACSFGCPNRREQTVPVTITRAQRDAIYEMVISRLTAIGTSGSPSIAATSRRLSSNPRDCGYRPFRVPSCVCENSDSGLGRPPG
ncbi:MAG: hypothetical protein QOI62_3123 [Solirubrobacteraceae bacterium]|jgi:hypothetical protein|nr:hypothetical protein [Solirubrobacteraceae bacterium]